ADPSTVDLQTLSLLIDRYPYAQSLRFIQARRLLQENGKSNINGTLLYTNAPHWLQGYLMEGPASAIATPQASEPDVLEIPIEHPASVDKLVYTEQPEEVEPEEKVSLYNDDHMPYSFLWWLNKTRMEHANTYQPYTTHSTKPEPETNSEATLNDVQLLDQ